MSSLIVLWLSYTLVGWKLFWGDIIYYVALLIFIAVILFSLQDEPWIQGVFGYIPQAVTVILILSLLFTFMIAFPATVPLVVLPMLSTFLAWQEMDATTCRRAVLRTSAKLWTLAGTALLGLLFGAMIDLFVLPGGSYS
jgi:hypothetical protein